MSEGPLFLTLDEVVRIHADMLARYGGADGVRDLGLVESAIHQPKAGFGDEPFCKDLAEMAAAYLFCLTKNHGFVDGNKRTGTAAAVVFLKLNGVRLTPDEDGIADLAERIAASQATSEDAVRFFRDRIVLEE